MYIIDGIVLGFGTAFLIGPVFFTLLQNAIKYGRSAGIATSVGIIASDIVVITICIIATAPLIESVKTEPLVKIVGASILFFMGLKLIKWPNTERSAAENTLPKSYPRYFLQGFLVNGVNPFVFVVWVGFIALGKSKYQESEWLFFIVSILTGIFTADILKSIFAPKINRYLTPQNLRKVYSIFGVLLLVFAARLLIMAFL